jgi:hypothetical protein
MVLKITKINLTETKKTPKKIHLKKILTLTIL